MSNSVVQMDIHGGATVIKGRRRERGTSFAIRSIMQLENLVAAIDRGAVNGSDFTTELEKSRMLLDERKRRLTEARAQVVSRKKEQADEDLKWPWPRERK